jgi:hypothetical protein
MRRPVAGGQPPCRAIPIFLKKIYVFEKKIGSLGNGPRLLGEWVYSTPIFLKLAPTLGSVKCSIPHGDWRFSFFSNFIFPKFRIHMDLHIYY